ncbi:hypothetical protein FJY71_03245 [candidate division WOR-3 bacterium]|nr:hypothetical protein [candidate division WOR-3 bacterium]
MGYGLTVGQTSLSRLGEWDFPLRRLRWRTFFFFLLCIVNLLIGLFVNAQLRAQGRGIELTAHLLISIATCVLALLAALVTFSPGRPGEIPPLLRWHPVLSVASLGLILTNGLLALLKILKV